MSNEHVLAVVDNPSEATESLKIARDSVQSGGSATVVLLLTPDVQRNIRDLARQQKISPVVAEQLYLDRAKESVQSAIGDGTETVVSRRLAGARNILNTATETRATAMTVPASLAGKRGWGRMLAKAPMPVTVTPSRAA